MKRPLYQVLSGLVGARANCLALIQVHGAAAVPGHATWAVNHALAIAELSARHLPSGAGFDAGTRVDLDGSRTERLVLDTSFHHMTEDGGYDGWTEHAVIITPSLFHGFQVSVRGRDRNDIKYHIADVICEAMNTLVDDNVARDQCTERLLRSVARGRRRHPQLTANQETAK